MIRNSVPGPISLAFESNSVAEPEPNFWPVGAESHHFKADPAASFRKAKRKNLVLVF